MYGEIQILAEHNGVLHQNQTANPLQPHLLYSAKFSQ